MQIARKHLSLSDVDLKMEGDAGRFSGYASKWDGVDSYGDTIEKGAFAETLQAGTVKMFYNHDWSMPIGKWTLMKEDDHGLYVEGELTSGLGLASDVRAAMKHGTIDGLSIGGFLKKGDYTETKTGRLIHKWSKLMEVSPVVFPADGAARIDGSSVKSMDFESILTDCSTERDLERLLRDAGLGKWEAMATVSRAKAIFQGRDAQGEADAKAMQMVLERLQKLAN